jgi:hypothetical protein
LCVISVVCCQIEVSVTSWSLVQRRPTACDASLCNLEKKKQCKNKTNVKNGKMKKWKKKKKKKSQKVSWNFPWHKSFRSHYGPGVDSASNRNEYRKYFLGVNAAGA